MLCWEKDRSLKYVGQTGIDKHNGVQFSVVTYNALADCHISGPEMYPFTDRDFLYRDSFTSKRSKLFIEEIKWLDADIYCFQEIDKWYARELENQLSALGYDGTFTKKADPTQEGLATFFKRNKFKFIKTESVLLSDCIDDICLTEKLNTGEHYKTGHVLLLSALECIENGLQLAVGNIHALWGEWKMTVTITLQIACACQALKRFITSISNADEPIPHIFCGDFNIEPQFPVFKLIEQGKLAESEGLEELRGFEYVVPDPGMSAFPDKICKAEAELLDGLKDHFYSPLNTLKSAYKQVMGADSAFTSYNLKKGSTLDYIWYSSDSLNPVSVLEMPSPDSLRPQGVMPSNIYPSDHFSLMTHLAFK